MGTLNQATLDEANVAYTAIFNKAFAETPSDHTAVAMATNSNGKSTTYKWLGQVPGMRQWIGPRQAKSLEAFSFNMENLRYEGTVPVDVDDLEDDQIGAYAGAFMALGAAAKVHPTEVCMATLAAGWSVVCYDGTPLFGDGHPMGAGGQSNQTNAVLAADGEAYSAARAALLSRLGDNDRSLGINPGSLTLVVPPQLETVAKKILTAESISTGGTNVHQNSAKLVVSPWLSAHPTKWFISADHMGLKGLVVQTRKQVELTFKGKPDDDSVFWDNQVVWGAKYRGAVAPGLWWLLYGSTGDAS